MSRETILDEAILKAKEAEDWQLAEWLRMARGSEAAGRWYTDKLREARRIERKLLNENNKLKAEIAELEGTIECLKGLAEANAEKCYTCEAMLDCDECLRADASHKELRGLQAEIKALRELVADMWEFMTTPCNDYCERCVVAEECSERQDYDCCQWRDECVKRMQELGIEVNK